LEVRKLFVGQFDLMEDTSSVVQDRLLSNNTNSYFYFVSEETGGVFSVFELCEEILSVGDTGVNPCAAVCVSLEPFREDSVEFDDPDTVEGEECVAPSVETSVDSHVDEGVGGSMPPVYEPVVADEYIRVDSSLKELFEVERSKYELVQEQGVVSNSQFLYELLVRNRTLVLSEQGIPPRLRVSPLED
jgi:hypothetical protein